MARTILQRGTPCADLAVYLHISADLLRPRVAEVTPAAFVAELAGSGTSAYQGLITKAGGWRGYVESIAAEVGHPFQRTACFAWSAGGRAAEEACASPEPPDAVVLLDALYGAKPSGSRPGDGAVVASPGLVGVARYAVRAARGETTARGPLTCVLMHSGIATPYASSGECVRWVQRYVEHELGVSLGPLTLPPSAFGGHRPTSVLQHGNLRIVSFPGNTAAEHVTEAHLWDDVCALWVPWLLDASCHTAPTAVVHPPELQLAGPPWMRGAAVKLWQTFLQSVGMRLDADGIFGPQTASCTRSFQMGAALPDTGVVDVATLAMARKAGFQPSVASGAPLVVRATLAEAMLAEAEADLAAGVKETAPNDGAAIREYLAQFWLPPGSNWCAAAVAAWLHRAAQKRGESPPIKGSPGARATMEQFKSANRWISVAELRANPTLVRPGMVPVWDRSVPGRPESSWWGHIGVTRSGVGASGHFFTIEGNSGPASDRVAEMTRSLTDARLFGMGRLD